MSRSRTSAALAAFLTVLAVVAPAKAAVWKYIESFATTQYKDTGQTTAQWDTIAGEIKLPAFHMTAVTGIGTASQSFGVEVSGNYAYVGVGPSGIQVFNITNPASPSLAGSYDTPGFAYAALIDGDYAYVADRTAGLIILDVSNPAAPSLAGSYDTPSEAHAVAIAGDYAYVADYMSGLQVIDISNPSSPSLAGSYDTPGYAYDVQVAGDHAYIADYHGGVRVIDISDPTNPIEVGSYATGQNAFSTSVAGDVLCVSVWATSVLFLDISDPTSPTLLSTFSGGYNRRVIASGNYAYVSDGDYGLKVIDFSNPSAPVLAGSIDTPSNAEWTALHGDYAFVADWAGGMRVIRISDPTTPRIVGVYDTPSNAWNVAVSGDYAYVADRDAGVQVVDINAATAPALEGSCDTPGSARSVAVAGDYVYVADEGSGLQVVDISDPLLPVLAGAHDTPGLALDVVVSGDQAYIADGDSGLVIFDISDPTAPDSVGRYDTDGIALGLAVAGEYAYVADGFAGVKVIDISAPGAPSLAGSCTTPGSPRHIALAGDYAYVADDNEGIAVIDIHDPTTPAYLASQPTTGSTRRVAVSGDYLFVAGTSALLVYDLGTPTSPLLLGSCTTPAAPSGVFVSDNYAYVAASESGLQVVEVFQRAFDLSADAAQSTVIETPASMMKARLSTTQQDTVSWSLSANGGANWLDMPADNAWHAFPAPGDSLVWRSHHVYAGGGINPACSDMQIDVMLEIPQIETIVDVPNDQGRQVGLSWVSSGWDYLGSPTPVAQYAVYRKIDPAYAAAQPAGKEPAARLAYPPGDWYFVATVPARCEDKYAVVVPTLGDSTITGGMYQTTFFVSALTATPGIYFDSEPDSGYSVDNLEPSVPSGFVVAYNAPAGNELAWDECPDADFQYFRVYRSTDPSFPALGTELVHMTTATGWTDPSPDGWQYYYRLTAVDFSGNESDPASAGAVTGAADGPPVPATFALHQNRPNPFNPVTAIRYDVPVDGVRVALRIYDVGGRLVTTLVDEVQTAGSKEASWDGTDARGARAASGLYFCRMVAGDFTQTRKMVLMK